MFMRTLILPLATALAAGPSFAQEGLKYSAGASLIYGLDGLDKVTHQHSGFSLEAAATHKFADTGTFGRVGFGYARMPGAWHGTAKTSLNDVQLFGDVLFPTFTTKLKASLGLSINKYTAKNEGSETFTYTVTQIPKAGTPPPAPTLQYNFTPVDCWEVTSDSAKGLKLGFRAGLEYQITRSWSAQILFQVTELSGGEIVPSASIVPPGSGTNAGQLYSRVNRGPVNPSWVQFGARYTF